MLVATEEEGPSSISTAHAATRTSPRSTRTVVRALLAAGALLAVAPVFAQGDAVPSFKDVDSMEARVQGCTTCHGQGGQGTKGGVFPRIAGKPAGYLYNQLIAFRDGTRVYPPMNYLVAYLPDAYLHQIAEYFAKERPAYEATEAATVDAATLEHGRSIATAGDGLRNIPACIACHGKSYAGMEPGIPGLVGLRSSYVIAQLIRWRAGDRHARAPDCMARVAGRLSDGDITAVAAWLSQQQAAKDPTPDAADLVRMPISCGSQS